MNHIEDFAAQLQEELLLRHLIGTFDDIEAYEIWLELYKKEDDTDA